MHSCKIFVSSPGDVALERTIVAGVVDRLKGVFGHRSDLQLLLWEQLPLDASQSFQPQLPEPDQVDLFLLILWHRMGTPLPDDALPEGFEGPMTGTEFEFYSALAHQQRYGSPSILVYRKLQQDDNAVDEVESFFQANFKDNSDRLSKAFHLFANPREFEQQLEGHLFKWFDRHLPKVTDQELATQQQWQQGNPFQGLSAFGFEQALVYRGRQTAIAEGVEKLKNRAAKGAPFLLVVGMSGSGKSSLMLAGILPALYRPQIVPQVSRFIRTQMRPDDGQGDPILTLANALCSDTAECLLQPQDLTDLQVDGMTCAKLLRTLLQQRLAQQTAGTKLIIAIDQLEELYTAEHIADEQREQFVQLVHTLVCEDNIWVITTLRSDCYHLLGQSAEFLELKQDGGQLDLQPPDLYNIRKMITEPAQLAHLHFEQPVDGGLPLDEVLANSAAESPESLPLLEFTLTQLYETRTTAGMMTFDSYAKLGGIEGAIASHAESTFTAMSKQQQEQFSQVFEKLVDCHEDGRYSRRWANRQNLSANQASEQLVNGFLTARLLVSELNSEGEEAVTLVHESLYRHWPRLTEWLKSNRHLLTVRNRLDEQALFWQQTEQDQALLLNRGKPLDEALELVKSQLTLDELTADFIRSSKRQANRIKHLKNAAVAALVVISVYATGASYQALQNQKEAEHNLAKSQDLIEFLIGDLHDQLSSLGRLDVMQSSGEKVIEYFTELDPSESTPQELLNRTKALYQVGEVYLDTNQYEQAVSALSESLRVIQNLSATYPDNQDYLFELSQAEFWLGYAYWLDNRLDDAETLFLAYLRDAEKLVAMDPDSPSALMELSSAYSNLGSLAVERKQWDRAIGHFIESRDILHKLHAENTDDQDVLWALADCNSWLGRSHLNKMQLSEALVFFTSEYQLFERLVATDDSYKNRFDLVVASARVSYLQFLLGDLDSALQLRTKEIDQMKRLVEHDPTNVEWTRKYSEILAETAKLTMFKNDMNEANRLMSESFSINDALPSQRHSTWRAIYFSRLYWQWRLFIEQSLSNEAASFYRLIMKSSDTYAQQWQVRIAAITGEPLPPNNRFLALPVTRPRELITQFKWAIHNNNTERLKELIELMPAELWRHPEIEAIQAKIESLASSTAPVD